MIFRTLSDGYAAAVPEYDTEFRVSRLRYERFEIHAELTVTCGLSSARTFGDACISASTINLSSAQTRQHHGKRLAERARTGAKVDWIGLLEELSVPGYDGRARRPARRDPQPAPAGQGRAHCDGRRLSPLPPAPRDRLRRRRHREVAFRAVPRREARGARRARGALRLGARRRDAPRAPRGALRSRHADHPVRALRSTPGARGRPAAPDHRGRGDHLRHLRFGGLCVRRSTGSGRKRADLLSRRAPTPHRRRPASRARQQSRDRGISGRSAVPSGTTRHALPGSSKRRRPTTPTN